MTRFEFTRLEKLRQGIGGSTSRLRLLGLVLVGGLVACAFFLSPASARTSPQALLVQGMQVHDDETCVVTVSGGGRVP